MTSHQATASSWKNYVADTDSINSDMHPHQIVDAIHAFPTTLKDDKRSLVKQGELFGKKIIAKQPRDKDRRLWIRVLSLFRNGEARSAQKTLTRFAELGINSVQPICTLEQRKYGCLIDSWIIYEFREGQESNLSHLPDIIKLLQKLHQHGYRHDDPNFGNFLVDADSQQLFLIDCKGKKRLGKFSDYYDFMLLSQRNDGVAFADLITTVNINTQHIGYKLATLYATYKRKRTEFKTKRRAAKNN